jgi:hypothetical protein
MVTPPVVPEALHLHLTLSDSIIPTVNRRRIMESGPAQFEDFRGLVEKGIRDLLADDFEGVLRQALEPSLGL